MGKYGGLVFGFAWIVDFLLLRGAAGENCGKISRLRCAVGAAVGGGYGVMALHGCRGWLLPVLLMMGLTAYGLRNYPCWGKFLFLWLVVHAMAAGVRNMDGWFLVLAAALLCLLALLKTDGGAGQGIVPITICYGGKVAQLQALRDNGNLLTDPVTGESVLIVSPWVGWKLLNLTAGQLLHPVETMESVKMTGLRLIPYSAVGQSGGMLLAMRFDDVIWDGQRRPQIVAFSPNPIGDGKRFEALAGGTI